jgi:hypothetical protein
MRHEQQFAAQICRSLDQGVREIAPGIAERLRAAREQAIQQQAVTTGALAIVGAGGTALQIGGDDTHHPLRTLFAILALLLGVSMAYYWNGFDQASENGEIDSALLSGDLPPNAYIDPGFQAWISHYAQSAQ